MSYRRKSRRCALLILIGALLLGALLGRGRLTEAATHAESLSNLVDRLQQHYQDTNSFSAHFTETLTSPGASPRERSGKISFLKPGRIRWEFDAPQPETIVSDGATLFDYDPGLNQVVETPLNQAFKSHAAFAFLLGVGNLKRDFNVARASGAPGDLERLVLTPRQRGDQIELGLDKTSLDILSLRVTDALGNSTLFTLGDIRRNVPLDVSLFKFTAPAGADIIDSSRQ